MTPGLKAQAPKIEGEVAPLPEPPAPALVRRYQANTWKLYLFQFCINFQFWWPIWVIYLQKERGLSLAQVTLAAASLLILFLWFRLPQRAIAPAVLETPGPSQRLPGID